MLKKIKGFYQEIKDGFVEGYIESIFKKSGLHTQLYFTIGKLDCPYVYDSESRIVVFDLDQIYMNQDFMGVSLKKYLDLLMQDFGTHMHSYMIQNRKVVY